MSHPQNQSISNQSRWLWIVAGPLVCLLFTLLFNPDPALPFLGRMAGIACWMAIWWVSEALPIGVTSFVPFIFLPVLGISKADSVAARYMDETIFLFMGGFLISIAIEKWKLHSRIAFSILSRVGKSPAGVLAGIMISAYLLSAWISNTATAMALIAAVMAVIREVERSSGERNEKMATAWLLGLAYACSIGGMTTLVGTPPNMAFIRIFNQEFPGNTDMDFARWFLIGLPISLLLLAVCYGILRLFFLRKSNDLGFDTQSFKNSLKGLGKPSREEKIILSVFISTALLWFTRPEMKFGLFTFPGWASLFPGGGEYIKDSSVAMIAAVILFLIPAREKGTRILNWEEDIVKMPLDILLLFGSGFALAQGFGDSGLSEWIASNLLFLKSAPLWVVLAGICLVVCLISEFASNLASIQLALPIIVPLVSVLDVHPLTLMVPATFAASLGFMLPVATAPNTIAFGSKRIRTSSMMKAGFFLDFAGVLIILFLCMLLGPMIWGRRGNRRALVL